MNFKLLFIALLGTLFGFAQGSGTVTGLITDKDMNDIAMPFASVAVKGSTIGTSTDIDGKYSLNIPAGPATLSISFVGYETEEVAVMVVANETITINRSLGTGSVTLEDVVLQSNRNKQLESVLLLEQKKAVEIKQMIGAQELERKGVGDVSGAVTKVTGISRQEGSGHIYVRGLGDRYNATTLNGLPLPSDNPSRKNINTSVFSTDIVQNIGIDKTYNFRNHGDFAGANIDIVSKEHRGKPFVEAGVSGGVNSNAVSADNFRLQDGPNMSGFGTNDYPADPFSGYRFGSSWNAQERTPVNNGFFIRAGNSWNVGEEGKISVFGTVSYDNEYSFSEGISRGSVDVQGIARKDFTFESYNFISNTTGMANVSYKHNARHRFSFNSLFVNAGSQRHAEFSGIIDRFDIAPNGGGFVRRSTFDRTSLWVNQLLGDHSLSERLKLDWGVSYNHVNNVIPDRMQNTFIPVDDNDIEVLTVSQNNESENHRYYQELEDKEVAARVAADYYFGGQTDGVRKGKLSLGYNGRFKTIGFEATQFNFNINQGVGQPVVDPGNPDGYFNQANFDLGLFNIRTFNGGLGDPNALRPQTFGGDQYINSGFAALEYRFGGGLTAVAAVRAESIVQEIEWRTALQPGGGKSGFDTVEVLPAVSMKYEVNDTQNLKLAASKTYTLPQFKERAPFQYEEVTEVIFGNPDLYLSTDYNVDLKWEWFPRSGELIAVTGFGKYIQDPINEVTVASATNDISFVNTGDKAIAAGAELEIRKNILDLKDAGEDLKNTLTAGLNLSYMYTNQDFNAQKVIDETELNVFFTDKEGALTGASDLLLNADVSWFREFKENRNLMATLAYNYFSDRLYAIGTNNRGNLVDKAVGTLDLVLKSAVSRNITLGLTVRNLLDPTIERVQETQDVVVESYKKGVNFKFSIGYRF